MWIAATPSWWRSWLRWGPTSNVVSPDLIQTRTLGRRLRRHSGPDCERRRAFRPTTTATRSPRWARARTATRPTRPDGRTSRSDDQHHEQLPALVAFEFEGA